MNTFRKKILQLKKIISDMTVGKNLLDYDLILGLISAPIIFFLELISFFAIVPGEVVSQAPYLIVDAYIIVFFIFFLLMYKGVVNKQSNFSKKVLGLYPYFIILSGILITYAHQGYSNRIESFFLAVVAAALIQIYPRKKRLFLFLISLVAYNVMMYLIHGFSPLFFSSLKLSIMVLITGYVYATVHYTIMTTQKASLVKLDEQNLELSDSMAKLGNAYQELNDVYLISESMINSTMEILKNDRLEDVLQLVLEEAIRLIPKSQAGSILVFNGESMEFKAAYGYNLKKLQKISLEFEDLFQSKLEDKYEPTIIRDLKVFDEVNISAEKNEALKSAAAGVAKSCLSCSFKYNGEFFGSLNLDNFDSNDIFDEYDKSLMKHFTKEVEIVISIHKLYEKTILPTKFDELTKVYTRRYFNQTLETALLFSEKTKSVLTVALIDINNLKEFNDEYGHEIGDDYLISIVETIRDGIPANAFIGRLGGDEFSIVFPNSEFAKIIDLMKNLRIKFHKTGFMTSKSHIDASFAFGVSSTDELGYSASNLLAMADSRMYEDKKQLKRK